MVEVTWILLLCPDVIIGARKEVEHTTFGRGKERGFWVSLIFEEEEEEETLPPEIGGFDRLHSVNGVSEGKYNSPGVETGTWSFPHSGLLPPWTASRNLLKYFSWLASRWSCLIEKLAISMFIL